MPRRVRLARTRSSKPKKKSNRGSSGQSPGAVAVRVPRNPAAPSKASLDRAALEYARLLDDPCNAPLTNSLWEGSSGSYLARFETQPIMFSGSTETAGIFFWSPGDNRTFINDAPLPTSGSVCRLGIVNTGTAALNLTGPGALFLQNTSSYRCIAACLEVSWPGSELSRSGAVNVGCVPLGPLYRVIATTNGGQGNNTTVDAIQPTLQMGCRMPDNKCTVKWFPGATDNQSTYRASATSADGGYNSLSQEDLSRNAIGFTVRGIPTGVGVQVRMVGVYEWWPVVQTGVVNTTRGPTSFNTINQVVKYLFDKSPTWFLSDKTLATVGRIAKTGFALAAAM